MTVIAILFFIALAFPIGFAAYKGIGAIRQKCSVISSYYISGTLVCLIFAITPSVFMSASSYGIVRPFGLTDFTRFWLSYPVAFLILFFFIVLAHMTNIAKLNIAILPIVLFVQIYFARYLMICLRESVKTGGKSGYCAGDHIDLAWIDPPWVIFAISSQDQIY